MPRLAPGALIIVINNTIFFFLSVIFVTARICTRKFLVRNMGWDDYLAIVAVMAGAGVYVSHMMAVYYGVGRVFATLTDHEMFESMKVIWQTVVLYNLTLTLCKLSIVMQYMRVFSATGVQWVCKVALVVVALYGCWAVLGQMFMCIPVASFWDSTIEGKCMSRMGFWFSTAALNIVTDLLITVIPLPVIKDLKLPSKARIALLGVFVVGLIVTVASCVRLKGLYQISTSEDPTNDAVDVVIWTNIEVSLASICAAIPPLKPLFLKVCPSFKWTKSGSSGSANPQNTQGSTMSSRDCEKRRKSHGQVHHIFAVGDRSSSPARSDECELVELRSKGSKDDMV